MNTKKAFFRDTTYIAAAKYSGIVISILITAVLARVLTPEDYGNVAIVTVFTVFFTMLGDMGIAPAIIQFNNLTKRDISSIFGFSFWIAIFLSVVFFLCSDIIANFYDQNILSVLCKILCGQIFFTVLNIVPNALLSKGKKFKVIAIRNIIIQLFYGVVAIIVAYSGGGVYSLLIAPVLGTATNLFVNVVYMRLPISIIPSIEPIKKIFSFSSYQFLFGFVNYFNRNMDKFIIGKFVNIQQLGYYEKSYRLMMMPIQNINGVITPVLHPYLADSQDDVNKIKNLFGRMTDILINIACIVALILFVSSREIILLVYGEQWIPAIICFKILSISTISQITSVTIGSFMQVCKQTKVLFYLGLVNTVIFLSSLAISVLFYRETTAICIAFVFAFILEALTSFCVISRVCFKTSVFDYLKLMVKPLLFFIILSLIISCFESFFVMLPIIFSFAIKIVACMIFSFCYLTYFTKYKPMMYVKKVLNRNEKK